MFRTALAHFEKAREQPEIARTQLEIARTRHSAGAPRPQTTQEYLQALKEAESSRRPRLVEHVERELHAVNPDAYCSHMYRRVRGRDVPEDTTSLIGGSRQTISVLYLDLKGSTEFALGKDPEEVMMPLNQMMADFVNVLRRYSGQVSAFRGDGFLALFREKDHAVRAVSAGLELLRALEEFNIPRTLLGLPIFTGRVGIATGEAYLGNVGTYDKMDFTAIGTTANLGARLESAAQPNVPCISAQTHEQVRDRFIYKLGNPRRMELKGLGEQEMWDVVGRA